MGIVSRTLRGRDADSIENYLISSEEVIVKSEEVMNNKILAIVGATASGKSGLGMELCERLSGELVSCDSMQIYKKMNIGTAKATSEDMKRIPHHLIDVAEPHEKYSCAQYVSDAMKAVEDIIERGKLPILCGGTGLYLDCFLRGGLCEDNCVDNDFRNELLKIANEPCGKEKLHRMLSEVDPESASKIHQNNVKRVIRALEIFHMTGIKKSESDKTKSEYVLPYKTVVIGIKYENREHLYKKIDSRVDAMLEAGLLDEVRQLYNDGLLESGSTAAQAIGYKELLGYIKGEMSYESAVEKLKCATRKYAKRQMTWFLSKNYIHWIELDKNGVDRKHEDIIKEALEIFNA